MNSSTLDNPPLSSASLYKASQIPSSGTTGGNPLGRSNPRSSDQRGSLQTVGKCSSVARDAYDVLAMFGTVYREKAGIMGSPAFGTAAGPPSECFHSAPTYEIQSPHYTLYYAAYPQFAYQPEHRSSEDVADVTGLSPSVFGSRALEYWHFGTRTGHNNELLLNLEIVRPIFNYMF
jgi:hypothetical protein